MSSTRSPLLTISWGLWRGGWGASLHLGSFGEVLKLLHLSCLMVKRVAWCLPVLARNYKWSSVVHFGRSPRDSRTPAFTEHLLSARPWETTGTTGRRCWPSRWVLGACWTPTVRHRFVTKTLLGEILGSGALHLAGDVDGTPSCAGTSRGLQLGRFCFIPTGGRSREAWDINMATTVKGCAGVGLLRHPGPGPVLGGSVTASLALSLCALEQTHGPPEGPSTH